MLRALGSQVPHVRSVQGIGSQVLRSHFRFLGSMHDKGPESRMSDQTFRKPGLGPCVSPKVPGLWSHFSNMLYIRLTTGFLNKNPYYRKYPNLGHTLI